MSFFCFNPDLRETAAMFPTICGLCFVLPTLCGGNVLQKTQMSPLNEEHPINMTPLFLDYQASLG